MCNTPVQIESLQSLHHHAFFWETFLEYLCCRRLQRLCTLSPSAAFPFSFINCFPFHFYIFKFFLKLCSYANWPPKQVVLLISADSSVFFSCKFYSQMRFVPLVPKRIYWMPTCPSTDFTARDLMLPLTSYNCLEKRQRSARKSPTASPYSVL